MSILYDLYQDSEGKSGMVTDGTGTVVLKYRELSNGVFLVEAVKFQKGKFYSPDELRVLYLINVFARGKIVLWPKGISFIGEDEFSTGKKLLSSHAEKIAREVGINHNDFVWFKTSGDDPADLYKTYFH